MLTASGHRNSRNAVSNSCRSVLTGLGIAILVAAYPAFAKNFGQNLAWQFENQTNKTNLAFIGRKRLNRQSGYHAAPVYLPLFHKQYIRTVNSLTTGNQLSGTAIGNLQTNSGNFSSSAGDAITNSDVDLTHLPPDNAIWGAAKRDGLTDQRIAAIVNQLAARGIPTSQISITWRPDKSDTSIHRGSPGMQEIAKLRIQMKR